MEIRTSKSQKPNPFKPSPAPPDTQPNRNQNERCYDRSDDIVAGVRCAEEAGQRKMDAFGDVSQYDIVILQGQLKEDKPQTEADPDAESQS